MSASNAFENGCLSLFFGNTNFSGIGDATGVRGSATAGSLYFSMHTADPGEAGDQTSNETSYGGYTRIAVTRGSGFVVTNNSVSPSATVSFPACISAPTTLTHFGVGTALTGTGTLLFSGTITPNIAVAAGVTPQLTTATAITCD